MVKKSFTLIEIIFVIVILGLISVGSFKAIEMLYERYYQANTITKFSILSQTLLDEVTQIAYYRIPITAIGYSPSDGDFKKLSDVDDDKYKIFEWISSAFDAKLHFGIDTSLGYTGFIDLDASNRDTLTLVAKDFNVTDINDTLNAVFNNSNDLNQTVGIIFAGNLDRGLDSLDYKNSYGWHGYNHNKLFKISKFTQVGNDVNLTMNDDIKGNRIYAKYYLVASAWGIARGVDINKSASCLDGLNIDDNTLLLFYNYRPWNNETFCADPHKNNSETKAGNVAILTQNVTSFRVKDLNSHLEIKVQLQKSLYRGSDMNITITKQKVVF
jgi:hypothetical protein